MAFFRILGILIFLFGLLIIFWNEGNAIETAKILDEGLTSISAVASSEYPEDGLNGSLIHVVGKLDVRMPFIEPDYGISIAAVKLKIRVQMYQWVEEEHLRKIEDGSSAYTEVTYTYDQYWKDRLVDSSSFEYKVGHENPTSFPMTSKMKINSNVKVGNYPVSEALLWKFDDFVTFTSDTRPSVPNIKMHAGLYYHGDPLNPNVGDIRIQFAYAGRHGDMVTIIAKQSAEELAPYFTESGRELWFVKMGDHSVNEVFKEAHVQNWLALWMFRTLGWFFMYIGCNLSEGIIYQLIIRYPLIREALTLGSTSVNMMISLVTSLLIISSAWVWHRRMFAFIVLAIAFFPFLYSAVVCRFRHPPLAPPHSRL